jgi:hypothetical protein
MEPQVDRVRRAVGTSVFVVVFLGLVGGGLMLGRMLGDAVGTAYVKPGPSAEGLPAPVPANERDASSVVGAPQPSMEPPPGYAPPTALPKPKTPAKTATKPPIKTAGQP